MSGQIDTRLLAAGEVLKCLQLTDGPSVPCEFEVKLPARPSAAEIERMDEALGWLTWCYDDKDLYGIMLARALGVSFQRIASLDRAGRPRAAIAHRYRQGIDRICRRIGNHREAVALPTRAKGGRP
ncbi:MAG TPA: DUF6362 family protein [Alphaproteobacteria bacterium]|nr:DUF6362 family protein [Alphaproteobacteria bacterium]